MKTNGRILIKAPIDYQGKKYQRKYAYEHRVVWWLHHKALPPAGYHIHHINEDPLDNRIENLECVSASDHAKHKHNGGKTKAPYVALECHACHIRFEQLERTVNYRKSKGQTRFFCCKSHQISYTNRSRACN